MINLKDVNSVIQGIKKGLNEVNEEGDLGYLKDDPETLLNLYSADFCSILLSYFPGATVMMNKSYRSCALLINGNIYTASGIYENVSNYFVAGQEELNYISKSFSQMSEDVFEKLINKLFSQELDKGYAYSLRKNRDYLT